MDKPIILVVDDEQLNIKYISDILKDFYQIRVAYSGEMALEILEKLRVDLILLDINMPKMDGFEVAKRIKNIPFIFLTAQSDEESIIKGFKAGARDYISKPFNVEELKVRVENQITIERQKRELENLNKNLEERVRVEVEEKREQEKILIQQSKMAEMGEMIGAIAHQWRQPLNALGLSIQKVKFMYKKGKLDDLEIDKIRANSMEHINFMSKTIDDFKDFFNPNKNREEFLIEDALNEVINILSVQFKVHNIELIISNLKDIKIYGFRNEFKQVLLNILNNSKDAISEKKIDGKIEIYAMVNDFIELEIKDNGGGIDNKIMVKIFNPYFTTKDSKGTGIGLYMSKMIIENNMHGKLYAQNIDNGVKFTIKLPILS